jgi:hypothetical protein
VPHLADLKEVRVKWLRAHWARLVSGLALAAVAAVAGIISFDHIESLTLALHQTLTVARLMPFGVDGLIMVGSVALLTATPGTEWLGWLGVGPGVAASVFANVESGIRYGWLAAVWAGVPAGSFFLACFLLERWLKAQASHAGTAGTAVPAAVPDPQPEPEAAPEPPSADAEFNRLLEWLTSDGNAVSDVPELHQEAAAMFAADLSAGRLPGIRAIREGLRVGQDKATQVQAYLRTLAGTP